MLWLPMLIKALLGIGYSIVIFQAGVYKYDLLIALDTISPPSAVFALPWTSPALIDPPSSSPIQPDVSETQVLSPPPPPMYDRSALSHLAMPMPCPEGMFVPGGPCAPEIPEEFLRNRNSPLVCFFALVIVPIAGVILACKLHSREADEAEIEDMPYEELRVVGFFPFENVAEAIYVPVEDMAMPPVQPNNVEEVPAPCFNMPAPNFIRQSDVDAVIVQESTFAPIQVEAAPEDTVKPQDNASRSGLAVVIEGAVDTGLAAALEDLPDSIEPREENTEQEMSAANDAMATLRSEEQRSETEPSVAENVSMDMSRTLIQTPMTNGLALAKKSDASSGTSLSSWAGRSQDCLDDPFELSIEPSAVTVPTSHATILAAADKIPTNDEFAAVWRSLNTAEIEFLKEHLNISYRTKFRLQHGRMLRQLRESDQFVTGRDKVRGLGKQILREVLNLAEEERLEQQAIDAVIAPIKARVSAERTRRNGNGKKHCQSRSTTPSNYRATIFNADASRPLLRRPPSFEILEGSDVDFNLPSIHAAAKSFSHEVPSSPRDAKEPSLNRTRPPRNNVKSATRATVRQISPLQVKNSGKSTKNVTELESRPSDDTPLVPLAGTNRELSFFEAWKIVDVLDRERARADVSTSSSISESREQSFNTSDLPSFFDELPTEAKIDSGLPQRSRPVASVTASPIGSGAPECGLLRPHAVETASRIALDNAYADSKANATNAQQSPIEAFNSAQDSLSPIRPLVDLKSSLVVHSPEYARMEETRGERKEKRDTASNSMKPSQSDSDLLPALPSLAGVPLLVNGNVLDWSLPPSESSSEAGFDWKVAKEAIPGVLPRMQSAASRMARSVQSRTDFSDDFCTNAEEQAQKRTDFCASRHSPNSMSTVGKMTDEEAETSFNELLSMKAAILESEPLSASFSIGNLSFSRNENIRSWSLPITEETSLRIVSTEPENPKAKGSAAEDMNEPLPSITAPADFSESKLPINSSAIPALLLLCASLALLTNIASEDAGLEKGVKDSKSNFSILSEGHGFANVPFSDDMGILDWSLPPSESPSEAAFNWRIGTKMLPSLSRTSMSDGFPKPVQSPSVQTAGQLVAGMKGQAGVLENADEEDEIQPIPHGSNRFSNLLSKSDLRIPPIRSSSASEISRVMSDEEAEASYEELLSLREAILEPESLSTSFSLRNMSLSRNDNIRDWSLPLSKSTESTNSNRIDNIAHLTTSSDFLPSDMDGILDWSLPPHCSANVTELRSEQEPKDEARPHEVIGETPSRDSLPVDKSEDMAQSKVFRESRASSDAGDLAPEIFGGASTSTPGDLFPTAFEASVSALPSESCCGSMDMELTEVLMGKLLVSEPAPTTAPAPHSETKEESYDGSLDMDLTDVLVTDIRIFWREDWSIAQDQPCGAALLDDHETAGTGPLELTTEHEHRQTTLADASSSSMLGDHILGALLPSAPACSLANSDVSCSESVDMDLTEVLPTRMFCSTLATAEGISVGSADMELTEVLGTNIEEPVDMIDLSWSNGQLGSLLAGLADTEAPENESRPADNASDSFSTSLSGDAPLGNLSFDFASALPSQRGLATSDKPRCEGEDLEPEEVLPSQNVHIASRTSPVLFDTEDTSRGSMDVIRALPTKVTNPDPLSAFSASEDWSTFQDELDRNAVVGLEDHAEASLPNELSGSNSLPAVTSTPKKPLRLSYRNSRSKSGNVPPKNLGKITGTPSSMLSEDCFQSSLSLQTPADMRLCGPVLTTRNSLRWLSKPKEYSEAAKTNDGEFPTPPWASSGWSSPECFSAPGHESSSVLGLPASANACASVASIQNSEPILSTSDETHHSSKFDLVRVERKSIPASIAVRRAETRA